MPRTQVSFQGNGPLANLQAIADATGLVKGKVGNPQADPPLRPDGKLDVGAAVGRGIDYAGMKHLLAGGLDVSHKPRWPASSRMWRPSLAASVLLHQRNCRGKVRSEEGLVVRVRAISAAQAYCRWCGATRRRSARTQAWLRSAAARLLRTWPHTWPTQSRFAICWPAAHMRGTLACMNANI